MATRLSGGLLTNPAEVRTSSATQEANLGAYIESTNGMGFRYVKNGATTMAVGNLYQASPEDTQHQNMTPTAAAIGDTAVTVTLGSTAVVEDEYKGGLLISTANAAEGNAYEIASHPTAAASATLKVTLAVPLKEAIDANSTIDLVRNPYSAVVVAPTADTSALAGVALHAIGASEYGWVQTHGQAAVRASGALDVGARMVRSTTTAGAVGGGTVEAGDVLAQLVGYALTGVATSEFGAVYLLID